MSQWKAKPIVDKDFGYEVVAGRESIACVFKLGDDTHANARLIAAAPELLEALVAAVDCGMVPISSAREGGATSLSRQVRVADQIRDAIAKAAGAQP